MSDWPTSAEWLAPLREPRMLVLAALLLAAALIDWRTLRIPNRLSGGGALLGLLWSVWAAPSALQGLSFGLAGLALGLGLMLPLYLMGAMGAGDVKLMAMVGAFLGAPATLQALLFVGITGGVVALLSVSRRRAWTPLWLKLKAMAPTQRMPQSAPAALTPAPDSPTVPPSVGKLPFGVSICLGTLASVLSRPWGFI